MLQLHLHKNHIVSVGWWLVLVGCVGAGAVECYNCISSSITS